MKNEFVHFVFLLPFAIFAKLHAEYPGFGIGLVCFQTRWRGGVFYQERRLQAFVFGVSNLANLNFYTKMKATERLRDMLYSRACRFIACRICISAWAFSVAYLYRRAMREPDTEIGRSVILTPFLCLFSSCWGVARCRYDDTHRFSHRKKVARTRSYSYLVCRRLTLRQNQCV